MRRERNLTLGDVDNSPGPRGNIAMFMIANTGMPVVGTVANVSPGSGSGRHCHQYDNDGISWLCQNDTME
jgi:hypothetical protein